MFQLKSTGVESAAILLIVVDNERVDNWHFFFKRNHNSAGAVVDFHFNFLTKIALHQSCIHTHNI